MCTCLIQSNGMSLPLQLSWIMFPTRGILKNKRDLKAPCLSLFFTYQEKLFFTYTFDCLQEGA